MQREMMLKAINLANKHKGLTLPNPSVGCVITDLDDNIQSVGVTALKGRPHAEKQALDSLTISAKDCILYSTLEPCSHYGLTPPCAEYIIQKGIKKVFIAALDPDERVKGRGVELLQQAGVDVVTGFCQKEAEEFYREYFYTRTHKKPFVTIKIAVSLDGKIATKTGISKWISGEKARQFTNFYRSRFDGILVGSGTYFADKPALTCRTVGLEDFQPKRFIISSKDNQIDGFINLQNIDLEKIYSLYQINSLLVEGGAKTITFFIKNRMVNRLILVRTPIFIGDEGKNCIGELGIENLIESPQFKITLRRQIEQDLIEIYEAI